MLKNIKIPVNHRVVSFEPVEVYDSFFQRYTCYKPVFERIIDLHTVVAEEDGKLYFLYDDNIGVTSSGERVAIVPFRYATNDEIENFKSELRHNNLMLKNNKIVKYEQTWWKPMYIPEKGFYPVERKMSDKDFDLFKSWSETFETEKECINWCNTINKQLNRDYPEL